SVEDFVLADQVTHPRIDPLGHGGAHARQRGGALVNPRLRDVRVDVTAPEEHRRAREITRRVEARAGWTDQSAAERDEPAVLRRVAIHELRGEARALREAENHDTGAVDTALHDLGDEL